MVSTLPEPLRGRLHEGAWLRTGHRGAPNVAPGNTLRSIRAAAALGLDMIEIDVHRTLDGRLALWHDHFVAAGRTRYVLAAEKFSTLQTAVRNRTGEELIVLEQALEEVADRAVLMVDLKAAGLAPDIVRAVRGAACRPAVVCGDDWDTLRAIKAVAPEIGTSLTLSGRSIRRLWRSAAADIDTDAVTVAYRLVTREFVATFHGRNIAVLAWTVDRIRDMKRLLAEGVDGLTSNRPDLLVTL